MGGHNPSIEMEKYEWSKANVVMFVDIIYEKVKQNKLQTSTFTNTVWDEINKELYQATKKNYGVERLKGKWNCLRTRQRLFAALLAHTGVTMDPDTGKVNAPKEVWAEFYLKNKKEYKSIRKEGCDHFHILSEVFSGTTATGDMHRASTQLPPTSNEERELEEAFINRGVNSYVEVVVDENEDVGGEPNNRRRRSIESSDSHRHKDPKLSKYDACMDKWSNTLQQLSEESIARQKYLDLRAAKLEREQDISCSSGTSVFSDPYSIDMCMQILNQMDNLSTQVYTKAIEAFQLLGLREIFMKIPSNRRVEWLDCLNLEHV
ncbi:L10-interacting MYB domain-containing protein-like [Curcuma longa]|uniref:L10-interacting MYB domain-containing protein-like n=1 Tax=Curcuma longa TaxID=136217 RepID=UPI003D9F1E11